MRSRAQAGLTWLEVLIALVIVGVLVALALPAIVGSRHSGESVVRVLSNMRQLNLATQQMVLDGETTGQAPYYGWPGDTGGTFTNWERMLVPEYLSTNDFCKLFSVSGRMVPQGTLPMANTNGVLVYAVGGRSPTNAIFFSTANVSNTPQGAEVDTGATSLFGGRGFVVFHKGGDGAVLLPRQITNAERVGLFMPLCR